MKVTQAVTKNFPSRQRRGAHYVRNRQDAASILSAPL